MPAHSSIAKLRAGGAIGCCLPVLCATQGGKSAAGRTARASEWGHTAIFDDEEDEEAGDGPRGRQGETRGPGGAK